MKRNTVIFGGSGIGQKTLYKGSFGLKNIPEFSSSRIIQNFEKIDMQN